MCMRRSEDSVAQSSLLSRSSSGRPEAGSWPPTSNATGGGGGCSRWRGCGDGCNRKDDSGHSSGCWACRSVVWKQNRSMLKTVVSGWLKTEQVNAEDSGVWEAVSRNKSMLKKMVFGWLRTEASRWSRQWCLIGWKQKQVDAEENGAWFSFHDLGNAAS